jgi:hypothetical protein
MLYIRNFNIDGVEAYYAVPTKKNEVDEGLVVSALEGFIPSNHRVFAGCVVQCTLATILGATAKDSKGVFAPLPVIISPYVGKVAENNDGESAFTKDVVGRELIISDVSITSGTHLRSVDNPIASLKIRKYLNALNSHMAVSAIEQFKNININTRFIDKDTKKRLVFIDSPDTPYNNETVYAIDHKSFTTSILDGIGPTKIKPIEGAVYLFHLDADKNWLEVEVNKQDE